MERTHQIRGSTALAATDLEHPFTAETRRLGRRAVVQIDVRSPGLVGCLKRQGHRRILFVGPVHERWRIIAHQTGSKRVPVFVREFCDQRAVYQRVPNLCCELPDERTTYQPV